MTRSIIPALVLAALALGATTLDAHNHGTLQAPFRTVQPRRRA